MKTKNFTRITTYNNFFSNIVLLSSIIIFSVTVILVNLSPPQKTRQNTQIYLDKNGEPKYAIGNCLKDTDCKQIGCSQHICSNNQYLASTCELSSDYPDKTIYSCGCIASRCVWYKNR